MSIKRSLPVVVIDVGNSAKPLVLVLGIIGLIWCWRVSRRATLVLGGVVLGANVTVQLIKHPLVGTTPELWGLNPLSGHVGLVGAVSLGWLVVAPRRAKLASTLATLVALGGITSGVVLAGWHTPAQVVCCLLICAGWALVGAYVMAHDSAPAPGPAWSTPLGLTLFGSGAVASIAAFVASRSIDVLGTNSSLSAARLGVVAATGAAIATVGAVAMLAGRVGLSRQVVESEQGHAVASVEAAYR